MPIIAKQSLLVEHSLSALRKQGKCEYLVLCDGLTWVEAQDVHVTVAAKR